MSAQITLTATGPGVTLQDLGFADQMAFGLSPSGAADPLAVLEAAALLGQPVTAALEMAGMGVTLETSSPCRFALTGAEMFADVDGHALAWNATHSLLPGQILRIGASRRGNFGYLTFGGGIATPKRLGSQATNLTAGIGARLDAGQTLPLRPDPNATAAPQKLDTPDRSKGGLLRVLEGPQTMLFDADTRARFEATAFIRSPRGNRQGVRLDTGGPGFAVTGQLNLLSEPIIAGDIQMTGDGVPYILLADCQTTGGYPRIGTIHPDDIPRAAQAAAGSELRFRFVSHEEALASARTPEAQLSGLQKSVTPRIRDPKDIADLLAMQLISGAVSGDEDETE